MNINRPMLSGFTKENQNGFNGNTTGYAVVEYVYYGGYNRKWNYGNAKG